MCIQDRKISLSGGGIYVDYEYVTGATFYAVTMLWDSNPCRFTLPAVHAGDLSQPAAHLMGLYMLSFSVDEMSRMDRSILGLLKIPGCFVMYLVTVTTGIALSFLDPTFSPYMTSTVRYYIHILYISATHLRYYIHILYISATHLRYYIHILYISATHLRYYIHILYISATHLRYYIHILYISATHLRYYIHILYISATHLIADTI